MSDPVTLGSADMFADQAFRESLSILICESMDDARELLAEILRGQGHRVFTTSDGGSALAVAAQVRPRVALIDVDLANPSGYEVARRLHELATGRPVRMIAITDRPATEILDDAVQAGFEQHLPLPVSAGEVLEVLEWVMAIPDEPSPEPAGAPYPVMDTSRCRPRFRRDM